MLQFYNKINNIIIKRNVVYGHTINVLCTDNNISEKLNNLYNTIHIDINSYLNNKYDENIKKCLTFICTDENDKIIKYVNFLINKKIKICLIVKLDFDFDKFVKQIIANDIEAISWVENDKKCDYYLIII